MFNHCGKNKCHKMSPFGKKVVGKYDCVILQVFLQVETVPFFSKYKCKGHIPGLHSDGYIERHLGKIHKKR